MNEAQAPGAPVKLVYFAWVRERIGLAEERIALPATVRSVADLLEWLPSRGENYAQALQHAEAIRVAVDHEHVDHAQSLDRPREIALFPPMTGG